MEEIREKFPNGGFVPVAVHTGDEMSTGDFEELLNAFASSGVPTSVLNRTYETYPFPYEDVIGLYDEIREIPALVDLSLEADFVDASKSAVKLTTQTRFAFDNNEASADYAISFTVTEDNVGPYDQNNGYAGNQYDCGGWESQPSVVSVVYNDVARLTTGMDGIIGSVPDKVQAGQTYTFNYNMPINAPVENPDNIKIVAYVLNMATDEVENVAVVRAKDFAGIDEVCVDPSADANAPVEYFNLQGVRVVGPTTGLYIRRQGGSVSKVVVR